MENNNQGKKILYRSNTNRVIFGVCGGLGEYFDIDPLIFRVLFIALCFGGGAGVLMYLILAFLIPKNPSSVSSENKSEPIDVKQRAQELASELKGMAGPGVRKNGRTIKLFVGLLLLLIGFGMLIQNLHLIPGFRIEFPLFNVWPLVIILVGLLILSN
jgi:phage shock protein PspC (stress-responsive transcriptional regulator)